MKGHDGSSIVQGKKPKSALVALILGISSVILIPVVILLSIKYETIGLVNLFRNLVFPVSIAAIIMGAVGRRSTATDRFRGKSAANMGLILGAVTFGLAVVTITIVALFFNFLLFMQ